ncbi:hypothetical protein FAK_22320 [Desulfoferula mesophila]|uniref:Transposase n=1 Tax=Desulfoferula mesophila TaxID=3058419 RepID=A0AAU9EDC1_9BACT|nr:hypothetical protein FAK_22320 [Desulfoferula mesophilus]
MACPTYTVKELTARALEIRDLQRRFDTVVIANIVIFTALLALKRSQVLNTRVRQVMGINGIFSNPIVHIKGAYQYHIRRMPLPLEYRIRMQEYLFYLKKRYPNFGVNGGVSAGQLAV